MPKKKIRVYSGCLAELWKSRNPVPTIPIAIAARQLTAASQGLRWRKRKSRSSGSKIVLELKMQVSVLRGQVDAAKAAVAENSVMLADAVLKYNAEDWLWRKRYQTLHMRHRRWLADVKRKANLKDSSAEAIVADLSAIAAEWDAECTVQETLGEEVDAASTLLAVEKNGSTAGAAVAAATFSSPCLANEARTEAADIMAAATAAALAAENSRKEVAGLFAEAVAAKAVAAAAATTAAAAKAAEEKKEAECQFAAAKKLFADASLKEAASN